jgi:hypothetical protein
MAKASREFFDKVAESIAADHPSFKIYYKNESRLMSLLALLAYPFNEQFQDGYITTLGSKVYFPSRADVESNYDHAADVLAHEGVHIFDAQRHGLWFTISYALNQAAILPLLVLYAVLGSWIPVAVLTGGVALSYGCIAIARKAFTGSVARGLFFALAGLSGLSYLALAVWLSGWWAALAVDVFLPLLPVSSLLRAKWEYRGYAMGVAIQFWRHGIVPDSFLAGRVQTFTGPDYYFMDGDAARVLTKLKAVRSSVTDGSILIGADARPYQRTLDLMKKLGLVKSGVAVA